jgi:hypothetical protein
VSLEHILNQLAGSFFGRTVIAALLLQSPVSRDSDSQAP